MKLLNLFIALLVCINIDAQDELPIIEKHTIGCGMLFPSGFPVMGTEYIFKDVIENVIVDSLSKTASVYTKIKGSKGELILFDLVTEKARWSIPFDYTKSVFEQYGSVLLRMEKKVAKTSRINLETGTTIWENGYLPIYINTSNTIALCYNKFKLQTGTFRALHGIDLQTGESLWWRDVLYDNGWNDLNAVNDSTVIINSDGLHCINLRTGNGWNQEVLMQSSTKTTTPFSLGLAATIVRFPYIPREIRTSVSGVCSNILVLDSLVYLSAAKGLFCYRLSDGDLKWLAPLNQEFMSYSILSESEGKINLCNTGYTFGNNQLYITGKPFLACFNPVTGKEYYMVLLNHQSDAFYVHQNSVTNKTYIFYHDRVISYNNATGRVEDKLIYDSPLKSLPVVFDNIELHELDTTNYLIFSPLKRTNICGFLLEDNDVLVVKSDLTSAQSIRTLEYYFLVLENSDFKIFANENDVCVANANGRRLASLDISDMSAIMDNFIYDFHGNRLIKIDLSSIGKE